MHSAGNNAAWHNNLSTQIVVPSKQEAIVDENERDLIREFQKFLIDKGAKIEANGEFDVETFIASMKMFERLRK